MTFVAYHIKLGGKWEYLVLSDWFLSEYDILLLYTRLTLNQNWITEWNGENRDKSQIYSIDKYNIIVM